MQKTLFISIMLAGLTLSSCQDPKRKLAESIRAHENLLFGDSLKLLNDSVALKTFDLYTDYADKYKEDTLSAGYLFKAADLALGMRQAPKAIEALNILRERYPDSDQGESALFMQAFIYDTELNDKDKAKSIYKEFMDKYPGHPLHGSAEASYEQLEAGLSDEDLIRLFESRNDSLANR